MRKLVTCGLAAAIGLASVSTASAQLSSFHDQFVADQATTASLNYRVPLGGDRFRKEDATYGVTLERAGTTQNMAATVPTARVMDFRLNGTEVQSARVGGMEFAPSQTDVGSSANLGGFKDWKSANMLLGVGATLLLAYLIYEVGFADDDRRACYPECEGS